MMLRAKYEWDNGNKLWLPKIGLAPLLFLEFLRDHTKTYAQVLLVQFVDIEDEDERFDYLAINLVGQDRSIYADAVSYINENIGD